MTDREEAGLRRLKRDLEEADWPSPELLARYASEPNRLREDEKQAVERALASSRIVADELATLRSFDFSRLDADRRDEIAEAHANAATATGSWLRSIRAGWLFRPPVLGRGRGPPRADLLARPIRWDEWPDGPARCAAAARRARAGTRAGDSRPAHRADRTRSR